ncbi:hypothetical protein Q9L58_009219 [Maublancomyces gigas]|uniref:Uncharacterized protein n=1 Tax=Discina gigas TaxID=1032678 RepID=A0ABR3G7G6_9PEZI
MLYNTLISFLLLALTPFFAFAQSEGSSSTTTTVSTTVTSTATSYVTMTGYPPSSTSVSSFTTSTLALTASLLNSTATSSAVTSTFETAISKSTGSPSNAANGTIIPPTPLASPLPGAAAGSYRASYSLGAGIFGAIIFGML